jgi:rfaE bifunctional protein kinase chain/domain
MKRANLLKIVDRFKGKTIGVIGDLIFDKYIFGDVDRISPEAPIPVVLASDEFFTLGGAGNVANNIAALGGKAYVLGVLGEDDAGSQLIEEFRRRDINIEGVIEDRHKRTTQKMRIIARGQHVLRVDKESTDCIEKYTEKKIIDFISENIENWDALIVSDYSKGLVTKTLAQKIISISNGYNKFIIGDTKPIHVPYFKNVSLLTPNLKEAREITGITDVKKAGKTIQKRFNCNVLITQGPQGMMLFEGNKVNHFPVKAQEVFDVAGAGDTVVAGMALSIASGSNLEEATIIANHAAGIVVGKVGTATVSIDELKEGLKKDG